MRAATLTLVVALVPSVARADGYYYDESFGISSARGDDATALGTALRLRTGIGVRIGHISIEPWIDADLAFDRVGASFELFGGSPTMGHADLAGYGLDIKYTEPLRGGWSAYARAGPRYVTATGGLNGYGGPGLGVGGGISLTGKVRALGFLAAPLFFVQRGPRVLASIYVDEGLDIYQLQEAHMPTIGEPVVATTIGFAVGTDF